MSAGGAAGPTLRWDACVGPGQGCPQAASRLAQTHLDGGLRTVHLGCNVRRRVLVGIEQLDWGPRVRGKAGRGWCPTRAQHGSSQACSLNL